MDSFEDEKGKEKPSQWPQNLTPRPVCHDDGNGGGFHSRYMCRLLHCWCVILPGHRLHTLYPLPPPALQQ